MLASKLRIPALSSDIPAFSFVIPAEAGIQSIMNNNDDYIDSRLRGNDIGSGETQEVILGSEATPGSIEADSGCAPQRGAYQNDEGKGKDMDLGQIRSAGRNFKTPYILSWFVRLTMTENHSCRDVINLSQGVIF